MTSENAQPEQPAEDDNEEFAVVPVVLATQADGLVTLMVGPLPLDRLPEVAQFILSDEFQASAAAGVEAAIEEINAAVQAAKAKLN